MAARSSRRIRYLVVWWQNQTPHASLFDEEIAASAAASVRNALLVEVSGKVEKVLDYWRRDDAGNPMPAEFREIVPPPGLPWVHPLARRPGVR